MVERNVVGKLQTNPQLPISPSCGRTASTWWPCTWACRPASGTPRSHLSSRTEPGKRFNRKIVVAWVYSGSDNKRTDIPFSTERTIRSLIITNTYIEEWLEIQFWFWYMWKLLFFWPFSSVWHPKKNKFGHFLVVVQLINRLTHADNSYTTTARLFFFPLLDEISSQNSSNVSS